MTKLAKISSFGTVSQSNNTSCSFSRTLSNRTKMYAVSKNHLLKQIADTQLAIQTSKSPLKVVMGVKWLWLCRSAHLLKSIHKHQL